MDEEVNPEDYTVIITEKGAIIARATPMLLGYGLTAKQILRAFEIGTPEHPEAEMDEKDYERVLGILMATARHAGVIL